MENEANNKNKKYDESRVYYVYKHIRLDNNTCFYIGKGKNGRKDVPNRNPTHDSICDRHGYKVVIFKNKLNEAEAFKLEEDMINCYVFKMGYGICIKGYMNKKNNRFLTNRTFGGEGSSGFKFSEESKIKMSEKKKGKKNSEEHNKNISEAMKGRKLSEETKRKMSEVKKGKGRQLSEEHKQKISEANQKLSKKVICITTGKIFNSLREAGNYYNVARSSICDCCKGKREHAGKLNGVRLQWKYAEDDDNESKAV